MAVPLLFTQWPLIYPYNGTQCASIWASPFRRLCWSLEFYSNPSKWCIGHVDTPRNYTSPLSRCSWCIGSYSTSYQFYHGRLQLTTNVASMKCTAQSVEDHHHHCRSRALLSLPFIITVIVVHTGGCRCVGSSVEWLRWTWACFVRPLLNMPVFRLRVPRQSARTSTSADYDIYT